MKMKAIIKQLTSEKSIIEVETNSGKEILIIMKTKYGHSYNDFAEWNISDSQYERLEELVSDIMRKMEGSDELEVSFDL